jgi:hypothetical protein
MVESLPPQPLAHIDQKDDRTRVKWMIPIVGEAELSQLNGSPQWFG